MKKIWNNYWTTLTLALAGTESSLYDSTSGGEIQSTTAAMRDPNTLAVNTWGWYPDSLANNTSNLFSALPSNSDPYELKKTSSPTSGSGDTTTISFGVNVDTTLPAGSYTNAIVISAVTNYVPQPILDVYPTTGWAGDSITLYSNGGFVNVQSVQIGGTDCTSIDVKSADELTCTLPNKAETDTTSGTDNGYSISVTASNTSLDTHNFTIRYFNPNRTETASGSNTQITNTNMSNFTGVDCGSLSVGDIISLTDERNGQTYRVKKMQDNKCWMVDNLKYAGEANTDLANVDGTYGLVYNNESGKYNTVDGTNTQSTANSDKAFYNNPMSASYCYGTSIQSSYTKCGYLYNWYAATAGSGTYAISTDGTNVSGSICPTGWNLPTSAFNTVYNKHSGADFAVLNASMNAGSPTSGSTSSYSYYAGWQFTGAWSGVFSGGWSNGFNSRGSYGYYWSSTASSSTYATGLYFNNSYVSTDSIDNKVDGRAIRCVKENTITIYFDGNGADGGEMKPQHIHVGNIENLNLNTYTTSASGYAFGGWNTMPDGSHFNLILSDRLSHLEYLMKHLPKELRDKSVMVDGKMTSKKGKAQREKAIEDMRAGKKHFLFAAYALAKEGLDIPRLDRLYLVTPQKDYAVIAQSVGRVARTFEGKVTPVVYDYVDNGIQYLARSFKKRCTTYRKLRCRLVE